MEGVAPPGDLDGDFRGFEGEANFFFFGERGEGVIGGEVSGAEEGILGEEAIEDEPPGGGFWEGGAPVERGAIAGGDGLEGIEEVESGLEGSGGEALELKGLGEGLARGGPIDLG